MSKRSPADDAQDDFSNRETYGAPVVEHRAAQPNLAPKNQFALVAGRLSIVCASFLEIENIFRDSQDDENEEWFMRKKRGGVDLESLAKPWDGALLNSRRMWNNRNMEGPLQSTITSVRALDGLDCSIGGVPCREWQASFKLDLKKLKRVYIRFIALFESKDYTYCKGRDFFKSNVSPMLPRMKKYRKDLEIALELCKTPEPASNLAASDAASPAKDGDIEKPKAARKGRKPAKRKARVPKLTGKQREALDLSESGMTDTDVGEKMGIERQTATEHIERGRTNRAAINAAAAEILAERSSGKSVKPDQNLRHGKRGEPLVSAPQLDDD